MNALYWIGALITLALAVYLFVAMFEPERF
jgi:K+-transporting ATPase KdpF subunit